MVNNKRRVGKKLQQERKKKLKKNKKNNPYKHTKRDKTKTNRRLERVT